VKLLNFIHTLCYYFVFKLNWRSLTGNIKLGSFMAVNFIFSLLRHVVLWLHDTKFNNVVVVLGHVLCNFMKLAGGWVTMSTPSTMWMASPPLSLSHVSWNSVPAGPMILCFILPQGRLLIVIRLLTSIMIFTYVLPRHDLFIPMLSAPTDW
jgi:hypothetical protein